MPEKSVYRQLAAIMDEEQVDEVLTALGQLLVDRFGQFVERQDNAKYHRPTNAHCDCVVPRAALALADCPEQPSGSPKAMPMWEDLSWANDACARFTIWLGGVQYCLWSDYPQAHRRESGEGAHRFSLAPEALSQDSDCEWTECDTDEELIAAMTRLRDCNLENAEMRDEMDAQVAADLRAANQALLDDKPKLSGLYKCMAKLRRELFQNGVTPEQLGFALTNKKTKK